MSKNSQSIPLQLRNEIKDIVISRLLSSITELSQNLLFQQEENNFLKKVLTFILKKFILFHPTSDNPSPNPKPFYSTPSKPTNSFQYIPSDFMKMNTLTSRSNKKEIKLHEYVNSMFHQNRNYINSRKNYFLNNDSNFLYKDLLNSDRKNSSYLTLNTESILYKNHSQRQIHTNKLGKKPSLNRITYRNFSMRNITNSSRLLDEKEDEFDNKIETPRIRVGAKKNKSKQLYLIKNIDNKNYLTTTSSFQRKKEEMITYNGSAKKNRVFNHTYINRHKSNNSRSPLLRNKI